MSRRRKFGLAAAIAAAVIVAAYIYLSLDESPPDIGPLALTRLDIPDAENAETYFRLAGKALSWQELAGSEGDEEVKWQRLLNDMAAGEGWDAAAVAKVLEANKDVFPLLDKGIACRAAQQPPSTIQSLGGGPDLLHYLNLARLMTLRAESLARDGKPNEALDQAVKTAEFAHKLQSAKGTMVDFALGVNAKQMGMAQVRRLLARDGLAADRLRSLPGRLAAVTDEGPALADTFRAEYALLAVIIADPQAADDFLRGRASIAAGSPSAPSGGGLQESIAWRVGYFYKPNRTARQLAEYFKDRLEEVGKPLADVKPPPPSPRQPADWLRTTPLGSIVPDSYGRLTSLLLAPRSLITSAHKLKWRSQTESAITQTLVALRCFKLKAGRLPQKLDELVPEFLPAVPRDDYDGKPIRYSPEKKIVYSVGEDLTDEGGFSKEEARKWWAANKPDEPLDECKDPEPASLPDPSYPIDF